MRKILAVNDDDYKIEIVLSPEKTVVEHVTDLYTVWEGAIRGIPQPDYDTKYDAWRIALTTRWGVPVGQATAFAVLEGVVRQVHALKKTSIVEDNSNASVLIQQEKQPTS